MTGQKERYSSVGEDEEKDTIKESKGEETELEEIIRKREQEHMNEGSLGGPINVFGEPILVEAIGAESSNTNFCYTGNE